MASTKKKNKLKNAFLARNMMKNKTLRYKRLLFYTPSLRRVEKSIPVDELEEEN